MLLKRIKKSLYQNGNRENQSSDLDQSANGNNFEYSPESSGNETNSGNNGDLFYQNFDKEITHIARTSIAMSQMAPQLAGLAEQLASGAQQQAQQSSRVAEIAQSTNEVLKSAMNNLSDSSQSITSIINTISRVAEQTKIIAINANIEAARAGEYGNAFGVVAEEVESLANRTKDATNSVDDNVEDIREAINNAMVAAGIEDRYGLKQTDQDENGDGYSVERLNNEMKEISEISDSHKESADKVMNTSSRIRELTEELLMSVGKFRIPAHNKALEQFYELMESDHLLFMGEQELNSVFRSFINKHPIFELIYITDANGIQQSANIWYQDNYDDHEIVGKDWSDRPWFIQAIQTGEVVITDIYRSAATDNFCFSIAGPIVDDHGNLHRVLAADVNFTTLLEY